MENKHKKIDPYNEEIWEDDKERRSPPIIVEDPNAFNWKRYLKILGSWLLFFVIAFSIFYGIRAANRNKIEQNTQKMYWDEYCVIKFKDPSYGFIIQRLSDTTYYAKFLGDENYLSKDFRELSENWDSFYFSKKVGDTLHFDYIKKSRFFKIKNGIFIN